MARYRRTFNRLWVTCCIAAFPLIFLSGLITGWSNPGGRVSPGGGAVLAFLTLAGLWVTVGWARQGIFTDSEGITVRNLFKTYRVRWDEIVGIEPPPTYGGMRNSGLLIRLSNGREVRAALYSAGPYNRPGWADPVVHELREQFARHRPPDSN